MSGPSLASFGAALALVLGLAACGPARTPAAPSITSPSTNCRGTPEATDGAELPAPSIDLSTTAQAGLVDVANGRAPSPSLPSGSIYLATVVTETEHDADSRVVTVWEWDVAARRPLRSARLPLDRPEVIPAVARIAVTSTRVYVTTELVGGGEVRLTVMNRDLATTATPIVAVGGEVSLEADEHAIAIAFRPVAPGDPSPSHHLRVAVYDPQSVRLVAQTDLGATSMFSGLSLPDAIELHAGRLYVVGVPYRRLPPPRARDTGAPSLGETTVFALDLPSLRVARTYVSNASPHHQSRMLRRDGRLFLASGGELVELTSELDIVREREVESGSR